MKQVIELNGQCHVLIKKELSSPQVIETCVPKASKNQKDAIFYQTLFINNFTSILCY